MLGSACVAGILTLCAFLPAPQASQGKRAGTKPAPALETFAGTLEEAKASAKERNVPLLLIGILEEEPFDEKDHHDIVAFRARVLEDPGLAAASALAVVVVANNRVHEQIEVLEERDGVKSKRKVCSIYLKGECALHMQQFAQLYAAYNLNGDLRCPFAIVQGPAGEVELRVDTGHAPDLSKLLASMSAAAGKAGEGFTVAALAEVRRLLAEGRKLLVDRPGEALGAFEGVLALTKTSTYAEEAREQHRTLLEVLTRQRDEALELLRAGKIEEGYTRLEELAKQTQGAELSKELVRLLRKAETDKETRDPVRAFKREREAETLFRQAQELLDGGDEREGLKKARLLLQRFPGTQAAERAKLAWPQLSKEG